MGQTQSTIPSGKKYLVSYCKQHNVKESTKLLESVDLSNLLVRKGLLNSVFEYKTRFLGYSFKPIDFETGIPLNKILKNVKLENLSFKCRCYTVSLENIKYFLSNFNVLIAGVIIDKKLSKEIFKKEINTKPSDIVLIVGYTPENLLLKTTWFEEILSLPFEFLCNIKEIWNINILSSEDKYLDLLSEC
jgi:hypothetical protein